MKAPRRAPATRPVPPRPAPPTTGRAAIFDPRQPWLLPTIGLLVTRFASTIGIPYAAEDAYITFRYARNFAAGQGLIYNPDERVFGFSSPVWTLWSSLAFKLGAPPVEWTRVTGVAADLVTLLLLTTLLWRHASRTAAWCFAFFFVAWPYFGAVSISGMESPLMLALIALAAFGIDRNTPWAGVAIGLLGLVRPEGLASAAVVMIWATWRTRLVSLAIIGAGVAALWFYFGSPIPQSVLAKSALYGMPGPWGAKHWWQWVAPLVPGAFPDVAEVTHLLLFVVVSGPAAFMGALFLRRQLRSGLAAAIAACLVVWLGYVVLGVAYFWWYLLVPLVGFCLLAATGLPQLVRSRALYVSLALMIASLWTLTPKLYIGRAQNEYYAFARAAEMLRANARPGQKVLLEPIGMIGFAAPVVVIDEIGLVTPQVARRRMQGPGWYTDIVVRERPDWLVVRRGVLQSGRTFAGAGAPFRNPGERDAIVSQYLTVGVADTLAGPNTLLVLRRR